MNAPISRPSPRGLLFGACAAGAVIGVVGGLIGLGGAEFRLPLLLAVFGFVALEAVILNKVISLVVVLSALLFRGAVIPFAELLDYWPVVINLLVGSLIGAWLGADIGTRLSAALLHRVIAVLLVAIAIMLVFAHDPAAPAHPYTSGIGLILAGIAAGFGIGVIASLLGVAGGEFLIPTLIMLFGVDVKLAGSLALAISLPTMLVGLVRYRRDARFAVVRTHARFALWMTIGSVLGAYVGARLVEVIPGVAIVPLLAVILAASAFRIWRHR